MTTTETALNTKVHELLLDQIARGTQIGTQVAAYQNGELIVDAYAGEMGPEDSRPVQADTLFSSFSTTKGVAATALHILADRGLIEYEQPVTKYWKDFGRNGKEKLTVAQAMSHQGGLHAMPPTTEECLALLNWENGLRYIEEGVPGWEPGTATGYHAVTYGWVAGGIIQHATGRHISDVIAEDIAAPLGIGDQMFVGIPDGVEERLASLKTQDPPTAEEAAKSPMAQLPKDHDFFKAMPAHMGYNFNSMEVRKACLPAANGHFSARGLARMYGALANGGEIDGVRLVSKERIPLMSTIQVETPDRVLMMPMRKSIGYFNGGNMMGFKTANGPRTTTFGHAGAGGSIAFADPEVRLSIAVTINRMMNSMQGEGPALEICELIRNELGVNE